MHCDSANPSGVIRGTTAPAVVQEPLERRHRPRQSRTHGSSARPPATREPLQAGGEIARAQLPRESRASVWESSARTLGHRHPTPLARRLAKSQTDPPAIRPASRRLRPVQNRAPSTRRRLGDRRGWSSPPLAAAGNLVDGDRFARRRLRVAVGRKANAVADGVRRTRTVTLLSIAEPASPNSQMPPGWRAARVFRRVKVQRCNC